MDLVKKLFKKGVADSRTSSTQFVDSEPPSEEERAKSRNAARRELVRRVLRESMARHGIPSDWLDFRALAAITSDKRSGMHVQLLVRQADQQLLPYVHAFQESFRDQLLGLDPTSRDWLFSLGWEFYGKSVQGFAAMPDAQSWSKGAAPPPAEGDTLPPDQVDDDVESDLRALQAVMSGTAEQANKKPG